MKLIALLTCAVLGLSGAASARSLLPSSETSAAKICLAFERSDTDIRDFCRIAIEDGGMAPATLSDVELHLGWALENLEDDEGARQAYERAIEVNPQNASALSSLGWYYWQFDDVAAARDHFKRSADLSPRASSMGGLATISNNIDQDYDLAIKQINLAIALDETYQWARREKGWIEFDLGTKEAALEAFRDALHHDQNDANAHIGASRAFQSLDDYESALDHASRAIEIDASDAYHFANRSYVLRQLGRNRQAIKDADHAIGMDPDYARAYGQRAFALLDLRLTAEALDTFEAGIAAGVRDNYLHYWYADALSDLSELDRALEQIDLALSMPGADAADYQLKAYILVNKGDYQLGLDAAQTALKTERTWASSWLYVALAQLGLGQKDASLKALDRAAELGLTDKQVDTYLQWLIRRGMFVTAVQIAAKYG